MMVRLLMVGVLVVWCSCVYVCVCGGGGGVEVLSSCCIRFLCAILFALKLLDKVQMGVKLIMRKEKDNVVL